jgi:DNA-binding response OmpR family regulator
MPPDHPTPVEGCTVVVADEDRDLLAFIVTVLRGSGCRVYAAYDALAAYELVIRHRVDLVVTNSCVGQVEGDHLIHALRRTRPALPILHISAGRQQDREVEARIPADVPNLDEPFTAEQLLSAVRALLTA